MSPSAPGVIAPADPVARPAGRGGVPLLGWAVVVAAVLTVLAGLANFWSFTIPVAGAPVITDYNGWSLWWWAPAVAAVLVAGLALVGYLRGAPDEKANPIQRELVFYGAAVTFLLTLGVLAHVYLWNGPDGLFGSLTDDELRNFTKAGGSFGPTGGIWLLVAAAVLLLLAAMLSTRTTRRRKARLTRMFQGLIGLAVLVAIVVVADWGIISDKFLDWDVAKGMFPRAITTAVVNTLLYTVCAFAFGLVFGVILALMRLSSFAPYRAVATVYIELFRGLPSLVVLFFVGFGLPLAFEGFNPPILVKVTIGIGVTAAAYMAETIRAGIQAVPKGQVEAARTLGMSQGRTLITIVLPQAFRIIIPPLTNEIILLVKDSSLVYLVGLTLSEYELTKLGQSVLTSQSSPTPLVVVAVLYLVITLPLSQLVRRLEIKHAKAR